MNKNKEYYKNTLILFIGKFATQFASVLLLPLFTRFLLTDDYGYVDLIQTYISLFVPIITLKMDSTVLRFLIDVRDDNKGKSKVITSSILLSFLGIIFIVLVYVILKIFYPIKYMTYMFLNIIALSASGLLLQMFRGVGKNKSYSISCIITGFSNLIVNIVLLLVFKCNASCILIASIVSNILVAIYAIFDMKLYSYIKLKNVDFEITKKMFKFALPMIPNSLSWWIINVSDRSIISVIIGVAANGIYTISCKFSNILNSIFNVFNMSWTEFATLHINDEDKDTIFNEIINKLLFLFSSVGLLIIGILPLIYNIIIGNNYLSSYNYIPILMFSNIGNVLSWLCGGIYVAKKETKKNAITTIISSFINLVVDVLLIKYIGIYAACISTLISFIWLSIYRCHDCQKYIKFKINIKFITIIIVSYIICSILYYYNFLLLNIINFLYAILVSLIINKKFIFEILSIILNKVKRRKNAVIKENI